MLLNARGNMKQFKNFLSFITSVQMGMRSIIVSPHYVVVSRNVWDEIYNVKLTPELKEKYYDELGEVTDEQWKLIEERLNNEHKK